MAGVLVILHFTAPLICIFWGGGGVGGGYRKALRL